MNTEIMIWDASSFSQPVGGWDMPKVTNMKGMFFCAAAFSQSFGD